MAAGAAPSSVDLLRPPRLRRRRRLAGGASSLDSDAPRADSVESVAAGEVAGTVTGSGEVSTVASRGLFGSDKAREYGPGPHPRPPRGNDLATPTFNPAYTRRRTLMFALLIGTGVAAGTFWYAKSKKKASSGQSAAAAAVTGAAGWGTTALVTAAVAAAWPLLLVGGVGAGIYYAVKKNNQKALPPASE